MLRRKPPEMRGSIISSSGGTTGEKLNQSREKLNQSRRIRDSTQKNTISREKKTTLFLPRKNNPRSLN